MGRSWGLFTRDDHARTMLWEKGNGEFIPGMEMGRFSSGIINLTVLNTLVLRCFFLFFCFSFLHKKERQSFDLVE